MTYQDDVTALDLFWGHCGHGQGHRPARCSPGPSVRTGSNKLNLQALGHRSHPPDQIGHEEHGTFQGGHHNGSFVGIVMGERFAKFGDPRRYRLLCEENFLNVGMRGRGGVCARSGRDGHPGTGWPVRLGMHAASRPDTRHPTPLVALPGVPSTRFE